MMNARRIDTHAHIVPPFYKAWLKSKNIDAGGLALPDWSVETTLDFMRVNGIETSILAVPTPGVDPADRDEARIMARRLNDFSAQVVSDRPRQFGFYATLPLPDVEGALAELAYAFDALHADGVCLHAHAKGIYLGDPRFDPLMEELNRRKAVIFIHPSELVGNGIPDIPAYVADFLLDSVRAAVNLSAKGVMERYPDMKVILPHAGGFLPYIAERLAIMALPNKTLAEGLDLLRRFYFDTALSSTKFSMPSLLAFADPDHITYGSDFPCGTAAMGSAFTAELDAYEGADHAAINRVNAERLFPRLNEIRSE